MLAPVLVDSNVILDIATNDPRWYKWSANALQEASDNSTLVINPLIYAEVPIGYSKVEYLPHGTTNRT
jgi:predicted nucleic acid-binding protein